MVFYAVKESRHPELARCHPELARCHPELGSGSRLELLPHQMLCENALNVKKIPLRRFMFFCGRKNLCEMRRALRLIFLDVTKKVTTAATCNANPYNSIFPCRKGSQRDVKFSQRILYVPLCFFTVEKFVV